MAKKTRKLPPYHRKELINLVAKNLGLPVYKAEPLVLEVIEAMKHILLSGEKLTLRGFGEFYFKKIQAYRYHDPYTKEWKMTEASRRLKFSAAPVLRKTFKKDKSLLEKMDKQDESEQ